jgi:hypothetical protein
MLQPQFRFLFHNLEEGGTQESLLLRLIKASECSETQRTHFKLKYTVALFLLLFYVENRPIRDMSHGKLGLKVSQTTQEG